MMQFKGCELNSLHGGRLSYQPIAICDFSRTYSSIDWTGISISIVIEVFKAVLAATLLSNRANFVSCLLLIILSIHEAWGPKGAVVLYGTNCREKNREYEQRINTEGKTEKENKREKLTTSHGVLGSLEWTRWSFDPPISMPKSSPSSCLNYKYQESKGGGWQITYYLPMRMTAQQWTVTARVFSSQFEAQIEKVMDKRRHFDFGI